VSSTNGPIGDRLAPADGESRFLCEGTRERGRRCRGAGGHSCIPPAAKQKTAERPARSRRSAGSRLWPPRGVPPVTGWPVLPRPACEALRQQSDVKLLTLKAGSATIPPVTAPVSNTPLFFSRDGARLSWLDVTRREGPLLRVWDATPLPDQR